MPVTIIRSKPISAKVTPAERGALERIARIEQLNLSEAQRLAIREAARRRGVWPDASAFDSTDLPDGTGGGTEAIDARGSEAESGHLTTLATGS